MNNYKYTLSTSNDLQEKLSCLTGNLRVIVKIPDKYSEQLSIINGLYIKTNNIENLIHKTSLNAVTDKNIEMVKFLLEEYIATYKKQFELEKKLVNNVLGKDNVEYMCINKIGYNINALAEIIEIVLLPCAEKFEQV